jgi:hypothetical protein
MTPSTDHKNIEKIVRAILQRNGIDFSSSLQLEVELVGEFHRYVTAREEGLTPAEARLRIANEFNELGQSAHGQERNITRQEFMDVMQMEFGSEDHTDWNTLLDFLVKAKAKGQTIQKFAEWCSLDPYNSPKAHQIAEKPLLVKQVWNRAFATISPAQPVTVDADGIPESY